MLYSADTTQKASQAPHLLQHPQKRLRLRGHQPALAAVSSALAREISSAKPRGKGGHRKIGSVGENVYTDPQLLDVAGALERLPELGVSSSN